MLKEFMFTISDLAILATQLHDRMKLPIDNNQKVVQYILLIVYTSNFGLSIDFIDLHIKQHEQ